MKGRFPNTYVPWDPCFGSPEPKDHEVLFNLSLSEYDEILRKTSGKKQYRLLCGVQTELVQPFRLEL